MQESSPRSPAVTIVLPTHNRAHLLANSVGSVLAQTFEDWELVIVDDNSTDDTEAVVARYMQDDPRIRTVRNDRYSHCCAGARLRGIDELRGRYVAFVDSDDAWPDYHLADFVEILEAHPDIDWVFGDIQRADPEGKIHTGSKFSDELDGLKFFDTSARGDVEVIDRRTALARAIEHEFNAGLQVSLLRARMFETINVRDVFGVEDHLFTIEALAHGFQVAFVRKTHLHYLVHDGNVSGSNRAPSFEHQEKVCQAVRRLWEDYVPQRVELDAECRRLVRNNLSEQLVWALGNAVYRAHGKRGAALEHILRGVRLRPSRLRYWKTLFGTLVRGK